MTQQGGPVLVTGATGNTGRAVVDALVRRGAPVRAMVRAEADRGKLPAGVPLAVADGAYLVVLSQLAADEHSPVRFLRYHGAVERHVRDLGIGHTFLRPNLFFQGLLALDIAEVAAITLTGAGHEGAAYTLTGPASITHAQIAAALTAALGRDVTFTDVPPGAFADSLAGILPPWQVQGLLEDYAHYRRGEAASVSPAVAEITGRPPRDIRQFARDYATAFTG